MGYIYMPSLQHQLIAPRSYRYVRAGGEDLTKSPVRLRPASRYPRSKQTLVNFVAGYLSSTHEGG
jgi:hypothetical protein